MHALYSSIILSPSTIQCNLIGFKRSFIVKKRVHFKFAYYVIRRPLVVSPGGEGRRKSVLSGTTGDVYIIRELQLDEGALGERVPLDEAVGMPRLPIDLHALDEHLPSGPVSRVSIEVRRADRRRRLQDRVPEGDLGEVGRGKEDLTGGGKRV